MKTGLQRISRKVQYSTDFDYLRSEGAKNHTEPLTSYTYFTTSIIEQKCGGFNTGLTYRRSFPSSLYMMSMYRTTEENGTYILFQHPKIFELVDRSGRRAKIIPYGPLRKNNMFPKI